MTATTRAKQARRRLILALAAVVVTTGGVVGGLIATGSSPTAGAAAQRTRTVAAAIGTLKQTVSTTGTIAPAQVDDLSFGASGQVTAVDVSVGQTVSAGQTLATIGTASLSDAVAAAQANLTAAESTLSSAEAAGASTAQIAAYQAAVTSAQSQLSAAQQSLASATLTSPIAGTVAAVNLSVGEQVSGSAGSGAATGSGGATSGGGTASNGPQIEVIGTGSWVVTGTITDTEVGQVKDGDQATIALMGSSAPVYGLVAQVGLIATDTDGVASFPFTIDVTGSPAGLYDGITADVSITTSVLADVLTVPTAALHEVDGHSVVYEMSGGKQVAHTVTTGQSEGGLTQIKSGLSAGADVVVPVVGRGPGAAGRTTTGRPGGFGGAGGLGGAGGFGAGGLGGAGAGGVSGGASTFGGGG
jgi:macrolide-specific efflux system membrane fusion protein